MRILMEVPARAVLEWQSSSGQIGLTFREQEDHQPHVIVAITPDPDDRMEGSIAQVLTQIQERIEQKKVGEVLMKSVQQTLDKLLTQPIPEVTVSPEDLIDEQQRRRRARRDWLLEQIEEGSYAAIEMLKSEFGEKVRIKVEVLGEAT